MARRFQEDSSGRKAQLIAGIKVPLMTKPLPIMQIAGQLKLAPQDVEPFSWFKGKLAIGLERRLPHVTE